MKSYIDDAVSTKMWHLEYIQCAYINEQMTVSWHENKKLCNLTYACILPSLLSVFGSLV